MRDIKFRAWNVITKKMIDLKKVTPLALNMDTDGLFIPFSDGLPFMQFTGLKDKNGKDIYEGDVIATQQRDVLFEVIFGFNSDGNTYGWNYRSISKPKHIYSADNPKRLEIIGNIYENPKLLNNND